MRTYFFTITGCSVSQKDPGHLKHHTGPMPKEPGMATSAQFTCQEHHPGD